MTGGARRRALLAGAGSGVGAATALALAPTHDLVLIGRRIDRLDAVAASARDLGADVRVVAHDLTADDPAAVLETPIDDLIVSAGLNTPRRSWAQFDAAEFAAIVATNLTGAATLVAAALPGLRASAGSVVLVSSKAAWTTAPRAGVAYRASKAGLKQLVDSLNEQESGSGVRACHLCPGEIDTEFLALRETLPDDDARRVALRPEDVARAVRFVLDSPSHVRIDELVISPNAPGH